MQLVSQFGESGRRSLQFGQDGINQPKWNDFGRDEKQQNEKKKPASKRRMSVNEKEFFAIIKGG